MLQALARFLRTPTNAVVPAHYRTYVSFNLGAIAAFVVHLGVLPLFWGLGAVELLWLNVLSLSAYATAVAVNRHGWHATMIAICVVELSVHQAACVHYLGWGTGFQYYLLVAPAFVFFLPSGRLPVQLLLLATSTFAFLGLLGWSRMDPPVYAIPEQVQSLISAANVVVVFGLLGLFGYAFHLAAQAAEDRLAAHERKQGEDRLGLLKAAVSAAEDVIVITDARGVVEFVNPAFTTVTGYTPAEAIGQGMRILKSGVQPPAFYEELWAALGAGRSWSGRFVNRRCNGELYTERSTITPIRDDAGAVQHFIAIKQDVTDAERAQERLARTEEELRQAKKLESIGTLAGGVAHDFNNLLTAILGSVEALREELAPDDARREHVEDIATTSERAAALTRQLLAYGRKQLLSVQVLDLDAVVVGIEKLLRRSVSEQVELVMKLAPDLGPVKADAAQLGQVLLNLVRNANDAMPQGGTLVVETANAVFAEPTPVGSYTLPAGEYVVLSVSDTGSGIAPEVMPRLFEPFFTTKGVGKGTGLGLSTVYGIVAQSGGHVAVESTAGVGSRFRVYLPATKADARPSATPAPREPVGGSETVLLVEDDDAVRYTTLRQLQRSGYRVLEAPNGQIALDVAATLPDPVHLLLCDVMMPGLNGPALAERVRVLRPDVRVIFTSGYPGEVISHHGAFVPGENFLPKPFGHAALATIVRRVLDA